MDNVVISSDFSGIMVGFKRKLVFDPVLLAQAQEEEGALAQQKESGRETTSKSGGQTPAHASKSTQPQKRRETADQKKIQEFLAARIGYAKLLTAYFASIGRQLIHVSAIDENQQTLDVFSVAIAKPFGRETHNLVSARDVIHSAESVAMLKKCRFKKVVIRGTDYVEAYNILP